MPHGAAVLSEVIGSVLSSWQTPRCCERLQAIRAPLVVAVLGGYQAVCGEAWRGELRAVWPHLARLICSAQPSVRAALAGLLQAQLPPLIAQL